MDAVTTMNIYDEAMDEAVARGVGVDDAHREAIVAAAMMLAAMDGVEDDAAREQVEEIVKAHAA